MKKQHISISDDLKDIINGYVMGDGYLKPQGTLTVDQGEKQRNFVEWLFEKLKPICTEKAAIKEVPRRGTKSYRFNTKAVLKDYYLNWYRPVCPLRGQSQILLESDDSSVKEKLIKKQLPTNIADLFSPVFITVWFACDGTKIIGSRGAKFEVTAFSVEERKILKALFQSKYDISVNIIRSGQSRKGTDQMALVINSDEYDKFRSLITQIDLIQNLFPYKLHKKN
jgi:hypothetical protein